MSDENKYEYVNVDALGSAKFFVQRGMKTKANQILDMIFHVIMPHFSLCCSLFSVFSFIILQRN
jgi:hypothetical protein